MNAWHAIEARNEEREHGQSEALNRFARDADARIATLSDQLASGVYKPHDLYLVKLPKSDGGERLIHVPSVRDRVLERAILSAITPHVDPWLGASSYAYRPGLGVQAAVQRVASLRDEGMTWALRADVDDCFPSIPKTFSFRMLSALVPDAKLLSVIDLLMNRETVGENRRHEVRGLAQGAALSPLLSNLVLAQLDDALVGQGFPVVRYADDFVVVTESESDGLEALRLATEVLGGLGMKLGQDKTEVMSFEQGFCFLGEDFGPRYPPAIGDQMASEVFRKVVYVSLQGSRTRVAKGRLIVESKNEEKALDVPISHVARVVCFGSVGFSAGARAWAMQDDVDVVFLSRRGSYQGQLIGAGSSSRVERLRGQLGVADDPTRRASFARAVIEAKVLKQIVVLQRLGRRTEAAEVADAVHGMRQLLLLLPDCLTGAEAMGIEGAAAREYFQCLGKLVPADMAFGGRSRRPPLDIVNAALSYGYAILLGECVSALIAAGLDPGVGFLHAEMDKRPSLGLDLMEEFRPMIVDQAVMAAVKRRELRPEHQQTDSGKPGVFLSKAGKKVLTDSYERRMLQSTSGALPGFSGSLRRHIYRQAQRTVAFISDDSSEWTGLSWR